MKLVVEKQYQEDITFEIKLELNGGTCEVSSISAVCGGKYSFPSVSKNGYVPEGWYTDSSFTNKVTEDSYVDYNIRTIYVKWVEMTNYTSYSINITSSYKEFGFYSITSKDASNPVFIDWGDGTIEQFTGSTISQKYHTYSDAATYTVKVSDNATSIQVSSNSSTYYAKTRYTLAKVLEYSTSITSIPSYCFYYCQNLTEIDADFSNITSIGSYAFYYCTSLSNFEFMKKATQVTSIQTYCFYYCTGFTDLSVIPSSVTSFGNYAFGQCRITDLSRIRSSDSLGTYCFAYNSTLTSLKTLPPRGSLPSYCFYYCTGLTAADLSQFTSMNSIPSYCFYYCSSLASFTPPAVASTIIYNSYCFGYTKISDLSFVKTIDTLNSYCFGYMNSLTSIETLSPRSTLPSYCFYYCSGLKNVDMTNWTSLSQLNSYTFGYDYYLTSFTAPSSLTGMSSYPLYYGGSNSGILSVDLSKCVNLTSIPNYAFYYTRGLKHIEFPENVKSIGSYAFYYCYSYLKDICIPSTVTSIGSYAFNYCYNLTSISCLAETAPTVQSTTFGSYSSTYTGRVKYSSGTNKLYVNNPSNYKTSYWSSILLDSSKCGFSIECLDPYNITYGTMSGLKSWYLSTGSEITPDISVYSSQGTLLENGTDYEKTYENNIEVGTASLSAIGKSPYNGTLTGNFKIVAEEPTMTELEYISNPGLTQFIKTGITPTSNTRFEIKFMTPSRSDTWSVLFGSTLSDNSPNSVLLRFYNGADTLNPWYGQANTNTFSPTFSTTHNVIHTVSLKYGSCVYDGTSYSIASQTLNSPNSIYLFGGNYPDGTLWRPQQFNCYYFKVYESDELILDLIPCIDPDNNVCMYDNVSGEFFYNAGSGTFTAGPVK